MLGFVVFDTEHNYTNLEIAKRFLQTVNFPIDESSPIQEIKPLCFKGKKAVKHDTLPYSFNVTIYDKDVKHHMPCELYFSDYKLVLDFGVAKQEFDSNWQIFTTYCLKGSTQANYVKAIENQMVKNLQTIDREFLDDIMNNPEKEDDLVDMHDYMVKEILYRFKYLKTIEKDLGLLHEKAYNPFAHPYFAKKEQEPRLVEIVEACNRRDALAKQTEDQKESV